MSKDSHFADPNEPFHLFLNIAMLILEVQI